MAVLSIWFYNNIPRGQCIKLIVLLRCLYNRSKTNYKSVVLSNINYKSNSPLIQITRIYLFCIQITFWHVGIFSITVRWISVMRAINNAFHYVTVLKIPQPKPQQLCKSIHYFIISVLPVQAYKIYSGMRGICGILVNVVLDACAQSTNFL